MKSLSFRRTSVVPRASCGIQRQPSSRASSSCRQARLCSLSLRRRCGTRACRARAPWGADHGHSVSFRKTPRRREASIRRRTTVVRRASCNLQRQAPEPRVSRDAGAPARSLSLGRRCSTRACRARVVPRCFGPCFMEWRCAGERPLSFDARPWYDVPAVASNAKPVPHVAWSRRAFACCL